MHPSHSTQRQSALVYGFVAAVTMSGCAGHLDAPYGLEIDLNSSLQLMASATSSTEIDVSWRHQPDIEQYVLARAPRFAGGDIGLLASTTDYADLSVLPGTTYTYTLSVFAFGDTLGSFAVTASTPNAACGDGDCTGDETCSSCATDCGACAAPIGCGDGMCDATETCSSCALDCGACAP